MTTSDDSLAAKFGSLLREDRAGSEEWARAFLHNAPFGMLATSNDGQPLITPNNFAFDEPSSAIYLHTAATGRMRTNIEKNPRVCFSVAEMGRLLPAGKAMEFSVEYASVVVFGRAVVVNDKPEARRALEQLMDKYFRHLRPGRDYRPIVSGELERTAVFRIDIEHLTGKKKQEAADFPGAFVYAPEKQS